MADDGKFKAGHAPIPGAGRRKLPEDVKEFLYENRMNAARAIADALTATKHVLIGAETYDEVPDHRMRVDAAEILYSRLWGKSAQAITGEDGGPVQLTTVGAEIVESIARLVSEPKPT